MTEKAATMGPAGDDGIQNDADPPVDTRTSCRKRQGRSSHSEASPEPCKRNRAQGFLRRNFNNKPSRFFALIAGLGIIAVIFVSWEVVERNLFPDMTTGMRHLLLTLRAILTTVLGCLPPVSG